MTLKLSQSIVLVSYPCGYTKKVIWQLCDHVRGQKSSNLRFWSSFDDFVHCWGISLWTMQISTWWAKMTLAPVISTIAAQCPHIFLATTKIWWRSSTSKPLYGSNTLRRVCARMWQILGFLYILCWVPSCNTMVFHAQWTDLDNFGCFGKLRLFSFIF